MHSIFLSGIYKKYKGMDQPALNGITIDLLAGEVTGLLGPNGAGKTTLINTICGLLNYEGGAIEFKSKDGVDLIGKDRKQQIGYVPQDYAFYPELTAKQNLAYFGALYNVAKTDLSSRIDELVERFGLTDHVSKKVKHYSGGMKRRLNLALALIHNPSILILDEPTVGVDVQSRRSILAELSKLKEVGKTIIYTSHLMNEAEEFCDQIVFIDHGEVVEQGTVEELKLENENLNLEEIFISKTGAELRDNV